MTPLRQSQSPPSHILLVLAHVSSCCLQFLNPFHSCQHFLAAEVAAGLVGHTVLEGAPKAPGNLEWECFCSPRDGQNLSLLWLLAVLCHHFFHALTVGCVGPQGLWPRMSWCTARAHRSPTHPPWCLQPQLEGRQLS